MLDAGGLFPDGAFGPVVSEEIYKVGIEAMKASGYDAMNLAAKDLQQGERVVSNANAKAQLPLVTTNIVYKNTRIPLRSPYLILDVNGITVGLLGISAPDAILKLPSSGLYDILEISSPAEAINHYLPIVRKKAQVVILLSSAGMDTTNAVLNEVNDIDLTLVAGNSSADTHSCHELQERLADGGGLPDNLKVMPDFEKAQALGHVTLALSGKEPAKIVGAEYIPLDSEVALDPNIVQLTGKDVYRDAVVALRARTEQARQQMEQEIQKSLQLSPEEYFMQLQQSGKNANEAK